MMKNNYYHRRLGYKDDKRYFRGSMTFSLIVLFIILSLVSISLTSSVYAKSMDAIPMDSSGADFIDVGINKNNDFVVSEDEYTVTNSNEIEGNEVTFEVEIVEEEVEFEVEIVVEYEVIIEIDDPDANNVVYETDDYGDTWSGDENNDNSEEEEANEEIDVEGQDDEQDGDEEEQDDEQEEYGDEAEDDEEAEDQEEETEEDFEDEEDDSIEEDLEDDDAEDFSDIDGDENDPELEEIINLISDEETYLVIINIDETLCYLLDKNDDGKLDTFYNPDAKVSNDLEETTKGELLIDFDDDGDWDYVYNPALGEVRIIRPDNEPKEAAATKVLPIYLMLSVATLIITILGYWIYHDQRKLSFTEKEIDDY